MSQNSAVTTQGFTNFPRQKLSDTKKDEDWYKQNVDYAEGLLIEDEGVRSSFKNKKINSNLRANIIDVKDFKKIINPDNLDLESLPANFQHIGIENSKINLLIGEYTKRKKDFKAYISSNDEEGISRKEKELKKQLDQKVNQMITSDDASEEEIAKELEEFDKYSTYSFQDIAEITANKILKYEYKKQNLDFLFTRTFEDLLVFGEEIVYCGVLGGEPVMRRVNPMNLYTQGGNSMYIEDSDIIVEYGYSSVGQVIDDYWDELDDSDVEYLETGNSDKSSMNSIGLNRDLSIHDYYGESEALEIFHPSQVSNRSFAGAYDTNGNVRVVKACWRSRRKIGKRKYYDDDGEEQFDYVDENYTAKKEEGEEITWLWVNEWLETTKIADSVYLQMRPVPYASKSLTNKSKGIPPYIGSLNSTNDYKVQALMDVMKPLTYSYDIAYYKRELEIATYKGSFAAINAAMVPSGWEPEEWIRYITINKFGFLDPTNEILKGPSQGKSAGAFNTLTATNVNIGDPQAIQMYTNILLDIEQTLGKLAGVTGAREGQIQNREAVGNVEREVAQTAHITEKWFSIDADFMKRALTKFLECCKYAYKKYPKSVQYLMDDMGAQMIRLFDEFGMTEMDIHLSNASEDTMLYQKIEQLSQAAIQNGQARIGDLIEISKAESVQEIARKLSNSAEKMAEEERKKVEQQNKALKEAKQMELKSKAEETKIASYHKDEDRKVQYAEIEQKREAAQLKVNADLAGKSIDNDLNNNGIKDELDQKKSETDAEFKQRTSEIKERELEEKIRSNKADEDIKVKQMKARS